MEWATYVSAPYCLARTNYIPITPLIPIHQSKSILRSVLNCRFLYSPYSLLKASVCYVYILSTSYYCSLRGSLSRVVDRICNCQISNTSMISFVQRTVLQIFRCGSAFGVSVSRHCLASVTILLGRKELAIHLAV